MNPQKNFSSLKTVSAVNPGVFVNIQQVNVQQPREVNFGVGEQRFKNEENEENPKNGNGSLKGSRPNDKFLENMKLETICKTKFVQNVAFGKNNSKYYFQCLLKANLELCSFF